MIAKFAEFCIRRRVLVVAVVGAATLLLSLFALRIEIKTVFSDLMPQRHPYIKTHNQFKETFGGSNMVSIMLEVEKGDIFNLDVLKKIQQVTLELQQVKGVNQFQIVSLASKKLKEVTVSSTGIDTRPLMFPDLPRNDEEIARLREKVLENPLIFGTYVSVDLKSTLVTVDFYDQLVDYDATFRQVMAIADRARGNGVAVRVVGEPILYGWVKHYLPETLHIFLITVAGMATLLFIVARTWRGTLLPLLAGTISAVWALGTAKILGFHFDPLVIVVAFLITARSISHSTQLVTRFDDEIAGGNRDIPDAARVSMASLFKPGMLGVIADAGCMIVVALTPIPLLEKVAVVGTVWVLTIAVGAVVMTPVLLSWCRRPDRFAHPVNLSPLFRRILDLCVSIVTSRVRYAVLAGALVVFVVSGLYAFRLKVGDANPGSPILWPRSVYNRDATAVNDRFRGSDRMFVVFASEKQETVKEPVVLENMVRFQRFMEAQPEIGGTISLADVLPAVKRTIREDNPRYEELGNGYNENGELTYLFVSGSDPGDIDRFSDPQYMNGSVTLFFRDHQGETIRTAISRIKEFASRFSIKETRIQLAGGFVGVLAAINEIILAGQIESIALGLLVLVICCAVTYRSTAAGMFFMVPVILSNTLTFTYMAFKGIGMNINTVPVAALGIGLGVDYAFYIVDGIREELEHSDDLVGAIRKSMHSAGRGVLVTAGALIMSVILWRFSSLRFQAEMGIMMALWLCVSAGSALFITPSMVYVFRPDFIVGRKAAKARAETYREGACAEGAEGVMANK